MVTIWKLKGRVTQDGKLDVTLPADMPIGEVDIEVMVDVQPILNTKAVVQAQNKETVKLLKSMGIGSSWAGIDNPVEFVQKQREEDEKQRGIDW